MRTRAEIEKILDDVDSMLSEKSEEAKQKGTILSRAVLQTEILLDIRDVLNELNKKW